MDNPAVFADLDRYFYGDENPCKNRREVLENYMEYLSIRYPSQCDKPNCSCRLPINKQGKGVLTRLFHLDSDDDYQGYFEKNPRIHHLFGGNNNQG